MSESKDELIRAFPSVLGVEAQNALSVLSENPVHPNSEPFFVRVGEETVSIPCRIYFEPPESETFRLSETESELLDCLLTRHHDGVVRQKHLARIIRSQNAWIPCFVVPLVGEYVVEIIRLIQENLPYLKSPAYAGFVRANPEYLALTEKRVMSYWNCYYRRTKREEYPGFLVLNFLKSLVKDGNP